jgi:glycosyltransferase involved in cell wall biosynthesis
MATKVLHAITGLEIGGAENMLLRLLEAGTREKFAPAVLSLMDPEAALQRSLAPQVGALRVPISTLKMPRRHPTVAHVWRLCRAMRAADPDLIQGWMYHGNLAASVGGWSLPQRPPVLWNVRHSVHDLMLEKPLTRAIIRLSARISGLPRAIIYNSRVSAAQHEALGFEARRTVVIPNGFDTTRLRPQADARARLCASLGIDPTRTVIGMIARHHPMKDHGNLVRAAALLQERDRDVHLVLIGSGLDAGNRDLNALIGGLGLGSRTSLLGERSDVPALVAGLDLMALSSAWGEAFPNVLGEAMASGVPCVATDVGDCAWVLGPHGTIVPPRDSEALARALGRLIDLGGEARRQLGLGGRARIVQHFSIHEVVRQYESLHLQVSAAHARGRRQWAGGGMAHVRHRRAV